MADEPISAMQLATLPLTGTEIFPLVIPGNTTTNFKTPVSSLTAPLQTQVTAAAATATAAAATAATASTAATAASTAATAASTAATAASTAATAASALATTANAGLATANTNIATNTTAIAANTADITALKTPVIQTFAQLNTNFPATSYQSFEVVTTDLGVCYSDGTKWIPVGSGSGTGNSGLYNVTAQNTIHLRAAIAAVAAGTGDCRVACIGDSTTFGAYANTVIYAGNKPLGYPAQLAKRLTAKGIAATNDSWFGSGNVSPATAAGYAAYNPAVSFPVAGFGPGSIAGLGAFAMACTTSGGTLAFTPAMAFDTIDIYYLGGTGGAFHVNVDGGATLQTITPSGTHLPFLATITGVALATHTINVITNSTTGVFIAGMAVRNSTAPQVEIYNMGWSTVEVLNAGNASVSYAWPTDGTHQYVYFAALPVVNPHLTIINLTINDIDNTPSTVPAYQAALQTMITQALLSGDCALMVGNPGNKANWITTPAVAAAYQAAVYALASSNNIALIDITERWVSYAVTNPVMPYGDAGVTSLHPSQVGYADIARAVSGIF